MTGLDHYRKAEELLAAADDPRNDADGMRATLNRAQLHVHLALVAERAGIWSYDAPRDDVDAKEMEKK